MIGDLSSFVELFAAVYLTISLDDLVLKRFWTPDYKAKMELSLKSIDMPDIAKDNTLKKADSLSSIEETRSRKRGIILFCFSVLLLILIGFEKEMPFLNKNYEAFGIIASALLYVLAFVFDRFCLKTGWRVLICSISVPLLVVSACLLFSFSNSAAEYMKSESVFWRLFSKIIILFTLIIPVLWQLFRNWIYTRYYLLYIVEETTIKANEYNYAVNFDTKKGHKMNLVANHYQNAVAEQISQDQQDREITPFVNTFLDEMGTIDFLPSITYLVHSSYMMHRKYFPSRWRLKRLCQRYDSWHSSGKKPTLEEFCKINRIDYALLRDFKNKKD